MSDKVLSSEPTDKSNNMPDKESTEVLSQAKDTSEETIKDQAPAEGAKREMDCDVTLSVYVDPVEYMLGLADLTGELMRMAINSVGSGDLDQPYIHCNFIRIMHDAFVSFGNVHRQLPKKLFTLKASLRKVEAACYTLQVRGSEIPKHMLTDVFNTEDRDYGMDDDLPTSFD